MTLATGVNQRKPTADSRRPGAHRVYRCPPVVPITSSPSQTRLQRKPICACGAACPKCQAEEAIQPKLQIGAPDDQYEQEADRVADQIMRMPEPQLKRQVEPDEEEEQSIQTKPLSDQAIPLVQRQVVPVGDDAKEIPGPSSEVTPLATARIHSLRGGGRALPEPTRAFFESRFGYDFSQVRVHTDSQATETARAVNAQAFTLGQDIVFRGGHYAPHTGWGKRLLAHELTHIVQQRATTGRNQTSQKGIAGTEVRANIPNIAIGNVVHMGSRSGAGIVQRQKAPAWQEKAKSIIRIAQRKSGSRRFDGFEVVWKIINAYYPSEASMVHGVSWKEDIPGIRGEVDETGKTTIWVGNEFLDSISETTFWTRKMEVGRELARLGIMTGVLQRQQTMNAEVSSTCELPPIKTEDLFWEALPLVSRQDVQIGGYLTIAGAQFGKAYAGVQSSRRWGEPTYYFRLKVMPSCLLGGAAAKFDGHSPVVHPMLPHAKIVNMEMYIDASKLKGRIWPDVSASENKKRLVQGLAKFLYHEGIHMRIFMDPYTRWTSRYAKQYQTHLQQARESKPYRLFKEKYEGLSGGYRAILVLRDLIDEYVAYTEAEPDIANVQIAERVVKEWTHRHSGPEIGQLKRLASDILDKL